MKYVSVLAILMLVGAAANADPCTSISFNTGASPCTESLTYVGGVAGADETLTFSDFTQEADITSSVVDLNNTTGLGGFSFNFPYINTYPPVSWVISYTAAVTSCATGFTCAITGYYEDAGQTFGGGLLGVTLTGEPRVVLGYEGISSDSLSGVNLQTATLSGEYDGSPPLASYETDVITSISAVPEPGNLSLFGAGLLGIARLRRARRGDR